MSLHATSTLAFGLISTGLVLGMDFSVRHMTTANRTMKSSDATPCQSVPNCWTFSLKLCGWTETTVLALSANAAAPVSTGIGTHDGGCDVKGCPVSAEMIVCVYTGACELA